jgi:hypothetical protein
MKDRRIGKFRVHHDLIERDPQSVRLVMAVCIVVRAEFIYYPGYIEYTAISPYFDLVEEGCVIPEYDWEFMRLNPMGQAIITGAIQVKA